MRSFEKEHAGLLAEMLEGMNLSRFGTTLSGFGELFDCANEEPCASFTRALSSVTTLVVKCKHLAENWLRFLIFSPLKSLKLIVFELSELRGFEVKYECFYEKRVLEDDYREVISVLSSQNTRINGEGDRVTVMIHNPPILDNEEEEKDEYGDYLNLMMMIMMKGFRNGLTE
jgi:hypothetical protein